MKYSEINSKSILTPVSGLLKKTGFTHSLNPYIGCSFGCSYCYVQEFPNHKLNKDEKWGNYVDIKTNATLLLDKELKNKRKPVTIFMSTATDPYQGVEAKAEISKNLLKVMLRHIDTINYIMIHTRSSLILRDLDILKLFGNKIFVSVTIETDLDKVRKYFTPTAPPIQSRFNTLKKLTESNIPNRASISPLLPLSKNISEKLRSVTNQVAIDDFFMGDGKNGDRSENLGVRQKFENINLLQWYKPDAYKKIISILEQDFDHIDIINKSTPM